MERSGRAVPDMLARLWKDPHAHRDLGVLHEESLQRSRRSLGPNRRPQGYDYVHVTDRRLPLDREISDRHRP